MARFRRRKAHLDARSFARAMVGLYMAGHSFKTESPGAGQTLANLYLEVKAAYPGEDARKLVNDALKYHQSVEQDLNWLEALGQ